jgi:predicted amidohydrolase YtcJ
MSDLPTLQTLDLAGATVIPGFIDAHTHLCWDGLASRAVDISACDRKEQVLETVHSAPGAAGGVG